MNKIYIFVLQRSEEVQRLSSEEDTGLKYSPFLNFFSCKKPKNATI